MVLKWSLREWSPLVVLNNVTAGMEPSSALKMVAARMEPSSGP